MARNSSLKMSKNKTTLTITKEAINCVIQHFCLEILEKVWRKK